MKKPRITISIACFRRPERTKRSIQCILDQDIDGWEAFIMGDGCPDFQKLIDSGYLQSIKEEQEKKGNIIHYFNAEVNGGGCGYKLTNHAIQNASGEYFIFFANDDVILPNHFSNYLEIENTEYDYMYFESWIDPNGGPRIPKLQESGMGHSEIVIKTSLAKQLQPHNPRYGHDWDFIKEMIALGKGRRSLSVKHTYRVMHVPALGTKDVID
jgi:glycosyltransferase involved in cell wall biosynthesis